MPRKREINGSAWIKFRTSKKIKAFLQDVANDSGITVSELCRNAVLYFFFGYLLGQFKHTFPELRDQFMKKFSEASQGTLSQSRTQNQSKSRHTR